MEAKKNTKPSKKKIKISSSVIYSGMEDMSALQIALGQNSSKDKKLAKSAKRHTGRR